MARQLTALEDLGLVAREPDRDGRAWLLYLTKEGRRRVREARRARYVSQFSQWDRRANEARPEGYARGGAGRPRWVVLAAGAPTG